MFAAKGALPDHDDLHARSPFVRADSRMVPADRRERALRSRAGSFVYYPKG